METATARKPKYKTRRFEVWTYDTWGNVRDGFQVNDRCKVGTVSIRCKAQTFNVGTHHEFTTFEPTDRQLAIASGWKGCQWEGQDGTYEAELPNGYYVGQLVDINYLAE